MVIYHFSVKAISRADGKSVVACAAYRAGEKLTCEHYGKVQDYTRKTGVEHSQIYAPDNTNEKLLDRETLWNAVEKSERRKDALLAREFEIAFPQELNKEQRQTLLEELCQDLVKKHGVIVDAAIHAPHTHGGSDERNYHAHIMFTTRSINPENGGFSAKKYRDFSRDGGTQTVSDWRQYFADLTNDHLAKAGFSVRVDHRSYKDQENGLEATMHEGPKATQLRRLGVTTEITLNNDAIKQRNAEKIKSEQLLKDLDQEILATAKLISEIDQNITKKSILSDEKTADLNSFDQILQKSSQKGSEKNIFDTLDSSISQLKRSQLDKTLESTAKAEHLPQFKADAEPKVQAERETERKAALELKRQNDRGNDFNPF